MGSTTVLRNEIRKEKKHYICDDCGNIIIPGKKYQYLYGGIEVYGEMVVLRYCKNCTDKIHEDREVI